MATNKLRLTTVAKLIIALLILLLIPISAFNLPKNQLEMEGFDPKLIDIDHPDGVSLNSDRLILTAKPEKTPFLTTITTTSSFIVKIKATVLEQEGEAMPIQIGVWDSQTSDTFSVWFLSVGNVIFCGARKSIDEWENIIEIGKYVVNSSYELSISFNPNSHIFFQISNSTWSNATIIENVTILKRPVVNLSFYATAFENESISILENYKVTIPTQSYYNYFVGSWKSTLDIIYALIVTLVLIVWRNDFLKVFTNAQVFFKNIRQNIKIDGKKQRLLIITSISLCLQILLSTLGSHPYDIFTQKIWAYITSQYSLRNLYPLSLIVPTGRAHGGLSILNAYYPYPPVLGYFYTLIGGIYTQFSPSFDFDASYLPLLIKLPWILFTILTGYLIFFFTKKSIDSKVALIFMFCFTINPGVVFDSALWGQSDVVLALFLVASILTFDKSLPGTLFFLGLSLFTKQTAVIPSAFMLVFLAKKYGFRKILSSLTFPIVCIFLLITPYLFIGYSPLFIFNVSVGDKVVNVLSEQAQGIAEWQKVVSCGAHNIWPILTAAVNGQSGWSRFAYPDYVENQILGVSYARFGFYLMLVSFFFIFLLALLSLNHDQDEGAKISYLLYLAIFSSYLFSTRMHERYLFLTIPFIMLAFSWINNRKIFAILFISLTSTFFLSIYATFALTSLWQSQFLPNFHPNASPINLMAFQFVSNDLWITILCIANILLFIFSATIAVFRVIENARRAHRNKKWDSGAIANV